MDHLYGGMDEPEFKIIDVFICKLRKKLSEARNGENYIETVWGRAMRSAGPNERQRDRHVSELVPRIGVLSPVRNPALPPAAHRPLFPGTKGGFRRKPVPASRAGHCRHI